MGENNSSEIRVRPLGEELLKHPEKVQELLLLVGCPNICFGAVKEDAIWFSDPINHKREKSLEPSKEHLQAIIRLLASDEKAHLFAQNSVERSKVKAKKKRMEFLQGLITEEDALGQLQSNKKEALWARFEGSSRPDLFIEGEEYILLAEGKLTEKGTTKMVSYLEHRNQMVRHIQGALNYIESNHLNKKVISFYIVPESFSDFSEISERENFEKVVDLESVQVSEEEKKRICGCYYGAITWEQIEKAMQIAFRPVIC